MRTLTTLPKTTWRPSSHEVVTVVMKNCEPFVLGPALAIDRMPGPVCLSLKFYGRSACQTRPRRQQRHTHLILEAVAVDGLAAGAVARGKVAALNHELLDDAVELGALVAKALLHSVTEK